MELLIVVAVALGYLAAATIAVRATLRWTATKGYTRERGWLFGFAVALLFYLVPFWDWIPTIAGHEYLCNTESGLKVWKTVEEWKSENKDVVLTLRYDQNAKVLKVGEHYRFPLNQRLAAERKTPTEAFLSILREEGRIVDTRNGEVLASYTDFFTPAGEGRLKFWLKTGRCKGDSRGMGKFVLLEKEIQEIGVRQ